jgi:hypothetical protein
MDRRFLMHLSLNPLQQHFTTPQTPSPLPSVIATMALVAAMMMMMKK